MHELLKERLYELRGRALALSEKRMEILESVLSETISTSTYRDKLAEMHQDIEIDLRNTIGRKSIESLSEALKWRDRFNHPKNHNKLVSIQKKEDWYFEFEDEREVFDTTFFTLSELPLESKLTLIDILQKS